MRRALLTIAMVACLAAPALAQDEVAEGEDDNGFIINLLQDRLSTESRKIRLSGVDGLLSSEASVARITISDQEGTWLTIRNARIVWSRAALLRGRVSVQTLGAEEIEVVRAPLPEPGAIPDPSAPTGFSVPDLPVSVRLEELDIDRVILGEDLAGTAAELGVEGGMVLEDGSLDAELNIERLDGVGGSFVLDAAVSGGEVDVSLNVSEPPNGIVANLIGIEGRPAVETDLSAQGTMDNLEATLDMRVGGEDLLDGTFTLDAAAGARSFDAQIRGRFRPLLPPNLHEFFAAESALDASGRQLEGGGFELSSFRLDTGALELTGAARTAADGFPVSITADGTLMPRDGSRLTLPGGTSIQSGVLTFRWGEDETWSGDVVVNGLATDAIEVELATLTMDGVVEGLRDPENRRITMDLEGSVTGLSGDDPALARTLDRQVGIVSNLEWTSGAPVTLRETRLTLGALTAELEGQYGAEGFDGAARLDAPQLERFAALLGRDMGGSVAVSVEGRVNPLTQAFDLMTDGTARDLRLGVPQADALLAGETTLSGGLARGPEGVRADAFRLANRQVSLTADGVFAPEDSELNVDAVLSDLALLTDQGEGRAEVSAVLRGGVERLGFTVAAEIPEGRLGDRALSDARVALDAVGSSATDLTGTLSASGQLGEIDIGAGGRFELGEGFQRLEELTATIGANRIRGSVARGADGLIAGALKMSLPDLSQPAALALAEASGEARLNVVLSRDRGTQAARIDGTLRNIVVPGADAGLVDVSLTITDLFGLPLADGTVGATDVSAAGYVLNTLSLRAEREGDAMGIALDTAFQDGTEATLEGRLANLRPGIGLDLRELTLARGAERAVLTAPATLTIVGERIELSPLELDLAGGSLSASGVVAETLEVDLDLDRVPLRLANLVLPDLAAEGSVTGQVIVEGPRSAPRADYSLRLTGATAAPLAEVGVPPIDAAVEGGADGSSATVRGSVSAGDRLALEVNGTVPYAPEAQGLDMAVGLDRLDLGLADVALPDLDLEGIVTGEARVTGSIARPQPTLDISAAGLRAAPMARANVPAADLDLTAQPEGGQLRVSGSLTAGDVLDLGLQGLVPLDPQSGSLDLQVELRRLSARLAEVAAPGQGVTGTLSGRAQVTGEVTDPEVSFSIDGSGLSATMMRTNGVPAASLNVVGRYSAQTVEVTNGRLDAGGDTRFTFSGVVPLGGAGIDAQLDGALPLALANVALARSRVQLAGRLDIATTVRGSLSAPQLNGRLGIAGGSVVVQGANLVLQDVQAQAQLAGQRIQIEQATANLGSGGQLQLSGGLGLGGGFPADLSLRLTNATYTDGNILTTELDGAVTVNGPLTGAALIAGEVNLRRTEISIPSRFGINEGVLLDIQHRRIPEDVRMTLRRAGLIGPNREEIREGGGLPLRLDLLIRAPNQIFIRGRGLDAEMGGEIQIIGALNDIQPIGAIDLIRGRLGILGQRIDFDEGNVTLVGNLDPRLRLVAETEAPDGTLVILTVQGSARDPEIVLDSQPPLPQDEILALLIFGRNLAELTPLQIAQLASAAATLAGSGGGLLSDVRSGLGLANLDITSGEDGEVGVRAGAYLTERVYLDVEADSAGGTEATINIDITDSVRGRASVDNNGESTIGVFFERDY